MVEMLVGIKDYNGNAFGECGRKSTGVAHNGSRFASMQAAGALLQIPNVE